ncbi:MAG: hypothetical protein G01um101419_767 [Parcubacteria group bacterium Gr01-1014_19]|nr:MAG: hypothetical protein G01um101419_767 [Parcubacteria group bacterium Gr01-1014_19]
MKTVLLSVLAGIFFSSWQFVMRASGISNPFVAAFMLNLGTLMVIFPMAAKGLNWKLLLSGGALMAITAGLINGIGHSINARLVVNKTEEISRFGAIIPAVCVLVSVICGFCLLGEPITWRKLIGICVVLIGITIVATK